MKMQLEHFLKYRGPNYLRPQGLAPDMEREVCVCVCAKFEEDYSKMPPISFHL